MGDQAREFKAQDGETLNWFVCGESFKVNSVTSWGSEPLTRLDGSARSRRHGVISLQGGSCDDTSIFINIYQNVENTGIRAVFTVATDGGDLYSYDANDCSVK